MDELSHRREIPDDRPPNGEDRRPSFGPPWLPIALFAAYAAWLALSAAGVW